MAAAAAPAAAAPTSSAAAGAAGAPRRPAAAAAAGAPSSPAAAGAPTSSAVLVLLLPGPRPDRRPNARSPTMPTMSWPLTYGPDKIQS